MGENELEDKSWNLDVKLEAIQGPAHLSRILEGLGLFTVVLNYHFAPVFLILFRFRLKLVFLHEEI